MKERISAALDGHEDAQGLESVLESIKETAESRDRWRTYCLIGDALRAEAALRSDVTASVMQRLDSEPTVLAPAAPQRRFTTGGWRRMLPLAASVMGVAAVGWVTLELNRSDADPSAVRTASERMPIALASKSAAPQTVEPNDSLRAYVFAHQSTVNPGAMPGVAPYVRTVAEVSQGVR